MVTISRRAFMVGVGAFGAATVLPRRGLFAQEPIVLGAGSHKYEWVKNWAKLPQGVTLSSTHGCVAVDSQDRIFVNTDNENAVIILDADGNFVKSWGKDFRGGAHGMTISKEGDKEFLYLSHTGRHEIVKCTLDGEVIQAIPYPEASGVYKEGNKRYLPTSVAVAPNGDIYGADGYGMHHVHQWNAKGEYIRSWNGSDGAAGKFNTPHGIAVDCRSKEMKIIVADRANKRIQVFTPDGKYISHHLEGLVNPCKVYVRGEDLLIPDLQGKVTILDKDNKLVCHLGEAKPENKGKFGAPPESWVDGQFTAPHGAAWDSQGNAYVEDWNKTGRVTKLKRIK